MKHISIYIYIIYFIYAEMPITKNNLPTFQRAVKSPYLFLFFIGIIHTIGKFGKLKLIGKEVVDI